MTTPAGASRASCRLWCWCRWPLLRRAWVRGFDAGVVFAREGWPEVRSGEKGGWFYGLDEGEEEGEK